MRPVHALKCEISQMNSYNDAIPIHNFEIEIKLMTCLTRKRCEQNDETLMCDFQMYMRIRTSNDWNEYWRQRQ